MEIKLQSIYKSLYLGSAVDYESLKDKDNWFVIHAAKEPYHRILANNYTEEDLSTDNPNHYWVETSNRLALNLMDFGNAKLISKRVIDKALETIERELQKNKKILVHCTFGRSRSASIVLLYLHKYTDFFKSKDFLSVEKEFLEIYPMYKPSLGIKGFVIENWHNYAKE